MRSRLSAQDGFIREIVWIAVILLVAAVAILDGMAIFNANQSVDNSTKDAAEAAVTEYAESTQVSQAKLVADQRLMQNGLELVKFSASQSSGDSVKFTVTAKADVQTYAFHYLGRIPQFKGWVERTTHPEGTGSAE